MAEIITGYRSRFMAKRLFVMMKGLKKERKAYRGKTHSSREMLEYSRGGAEERKLGRLLESDWVVVSTVMCLSGNDVWGTISSTAQHLKHTYTSRECYLMKSSTI